MQSAFEYQPEFENDARQSKEAYRSVGVDTVRLLIRDAIAPAQHHEAHFPIPVSRKREHLRRPTAVRAKCQGNWGTSDCLVSEISEGGASVVCGHTPTVGEQLTLEWPSHGRQRPLRILCSVRHVTGTHTGVAFLGISAESKSRLREILKIA